MKLHTIKDNGNKYCGPSVIAAITGLGTKESALIIRAGTIRSRVTFTSTNEMRRALSRLGYQLRHIYAPVNPPCLLKDWAPDAQQTYLLNVDNHWILTQGQDAQCGITKVSVLAKDHPYADLPVKDALRINLESEIDPASVYEYALDLCGRRPDSSSEKYAQRQAKKLAAEYEIDIQRDSPDTSIWVYPPASLEEDPFEEHFLDRWSEVLTRVKEYRAAIDQQSESQGTAPCCA